MAIRMCKFKVDTCGQYDSTVQLGTRSKLNYNVMTQPGKVSVIDLRATCGVACHAIFLPNTTSYEAFALDYDDYDVET